VHRIIEGLAADTPLYEGGSLEEVLWRLARRILRAALMPMAPSLNLVDGGRGAALSRARRDGRTRRRPERGGRADRRHAGARGAGALAIERPAFAAEQFLQLVVTLAQASASTCCRQHYGSPPPFKISQRPFDRRFQTAEIVAHDPPDRVRVDTIGGVSKDVSETSDRLPRLLWRQRFGVPLQSPSSFADDQERVQDRVKRLLVLAECFEIEPRREPLDADDIV
jgi:hypothetical protein